VTRVLTPFNFIDTSINTSKYPGYLGGEPHLYFGQLNRGGGYLRKEPKMFGSQRYERNNQIIRGGRDAILRLATVN